MSRLSALMLEEQRLGSDELKKMLTEMIEEEERGRVETSAGTY